MAFLPQLLSRFRKGVASPRVEPTEDVDQTEPSSEVPAPGAVFDVETVAVGQDVTGRADDDAPPPRQGFGLSMRSWSAKKTQKDETRSVFIGLQVAGSELWLQLNADGHAGEIPDLPDNPEDATRIFGRSRVFRGMEYDRGVRVSTKLRGKALRNNLMRELNDMPVWFKKDGLSWFTRRESQSMSGYAVRPLTFALWQFAKSLGYHPSSGVLLRLRFPMGSTVLWAFLAMGANGVGTFQAMRTSSGANRPAFNPQLASGVLDKEFQSLDVDPSDVWAFLASSTDSKVPSYPQRGEWMGKPKTLVGKIIAGGGLIALMIGAGFWFWSETALQEALAQKQAEAARIAQFQSAQQAYFSSHIQGITLLHRIHLSHIVGDAASLWKPGTTITMADGMPLSMSAGPLLARPGGAGMPGAGGNSGVLFHVHIPATKSLGPGQPYWVSQSLLHAVISQTPPSGIILQSVQKTGGNGYVALFGGH